MTTSFSLAVLNNISYITE